MTDTPMLNHVKNIGAFISEVRHQKLAKGLAFSFDIYIDKRLCIEVEE